MKLRFVVETHLSPLARMLHVSAKAGAAGRCGHCAACVDKGINVACMHGGKVNGRGGRNHDAPHPGMYFVSLEDTGCNGQIFQPSIGAGTNNHLVNGNVSKGAYHLCVFRQMGRETTGFMEDRR